MQQIGHNAVARTDHFRDGARAIADQVCETQSLEGITWPEENQYTSQLLLEAISAALQKAAVAENETQAIP